MNTCKDCKHWMGNINYHVWGNCDAVYNINDYDYYKDENENENLKIDQKMMLIHNEADYNGGGDFRTHKDFGCISFTAKSRSKKAASRS